MYHLTPYFVLGADCRCQRQPGSFAPRTLLPASSPAVKNHTRVKPIQYKAVGFSSICNSQFAIRNSQSTKKKAFSILEVILALAILTGAMVVLGELGHLGFRNAKATQDLTKAQLLCESKMAEFTSGITAPQTVSGAAFDTIDQDAGSTWVYSVAMEQIDQAGLIALCVTVTQNIPATQHPISYSITRWITDPSIGQSTDASQGSNTGASGTGNSNAQ